MQKHASISFAWTIRDAPSQRLAPLISQMVKLDSIDKIIAETDALAGLVFEYRSYVQNFDWSCVREVVAARLEGSRRSIKGHLLEARVRTALAAAFQHYFSIYSNYGRFKKVTLANTQIKLGTCTIDVSAELEPRDGGPKETLLMPIKTRETQGGDMPVCSHGILHPLLLSSPVMQIPTIWQL